MTKPLHKYWVKGTNREEGTPRRSQNWVTSRHAWFKIFKDRVECGDWLISFSAVKEAIVYKTRSLFLPVSVLQIKTANQIYQFGFYPWANPMKHVTFDYAEEKVKLRHSPFSVMLRLILVLYLVYLLWERYH